VGSEASATALKTGCWIIFAIAAICGVLYAIGYILVVVLDVYA
jgi:hypothetical protein